MIQLEHIQLLAQNNNGAGAAAAAGGMFAVLLLLFELALIILVIAGLWKTFEKAGKPGWAAIVPIYNVIVLLEIRWQADLVDSAILYSVCKHRHFHCRFH